VEFEISSLSTEFEGTYSLDLAAGGMGFCMSEMTAQASPLPATRRGAEMGWRVGVSIVTVFGWLSFLLLYLAFWASGFNWGQSLALILVSILVFVGINGAVWASWGPRNVSILNR